MTEKMRSYVEGMLTGLFNAAASPAGDRIPVAYLYNGVRLPELPEQEPYAVISDVGDEYWLTVLDADPYVMDGRLTIREPTSTRVYRIEGEAWTPFIAPDYVTGECIVDAVQVIWTRSDILNEDGSVYLAGSSPVPVYATEVTTDG